jgi:hypothetical protein
MTSHALATFREMVVDHNIQPTVHLYFLIQIEIHVHIIFVSYWLCLKFYLPVATFHCIDCGLWSRSSTPID